MKTIFAFLLAFLAQDALCQTGSNHNGLTSMLPTPTAYSLGKFGTVPVSPYTGTANIMIPIYSTEQRGLPLDINLQYDTSGLLVNCLPSWTGHGWSLNAGGMITREVGMFEDELDKSDYNYPWDHFKNYFNNCHNVNDSMAVYTSNVQSNLYSSASENILFNNGNYADFAPDIFHFNFMGITGRFFLGGDGQWKVHSDHNIEVLFDYNDTDNFIFPIDSSFSTDIGIKPLPKTIKGFTLVDDRGYRYEFGGGVNSIEYSTDLMCTRNHMDKVKWIADTWMLSKIKDRFGNSLYDFDYRRGKFIVQITSSHVEEELNNTNFYNRTHSFYRLNAPVYLSKIIIGDGTAISFIRESAFTDSVASRVLYPFCYNNNQFIVDSNYQLSHNYSDAYYYLQSNKWSSFQANPTVNKYDDPLSSMDIALLKSINIKSPSYILRSYALHYDYNSRIHLDSVNIYTDNDKKIGAYSLKYNNYNLLPKDYLTTEFDYWGYYNGDTLDGNSFEVYDPILGQTINTQTNTKIMTPNSTTSKYGMLTSIEYPTGGCTVLEYEQNTYSSHLEENRQTVIIDSEDYNAGGLRIKSVSDYEDTTKQKLLSKREYLYSENISGRSSGILFAVPNRTCNWSNNSGYSNYNITTKRLVSIIPLSNSFGPHIGYSSVIEKNLNGEYTVFHYSNMSDYKDQRFSASAMNCNSTTTWTPYDRFSERGYMRGKLLSQKIYTSNNLKVKEIVFHYNDDYNFNSTNFVWTHNINSHSLPGDNSCLVGGIYKLYYPKISLISKVEKTLMGNQWVCDSTKYIYSDFKETDGNSGYEAMFRKCLQETTYRGNDHITTKYQYALGDVTPMNSLPGNLAEFVPDTSLFNHEFYAPQTAVSTFFNGDFIKGHRTEYGTFDGRKMPKFEILYNGNQQYGDTLLQYDSYTNKGLLEEYTDKAHVKTKIKWNTNNRLIATAINMSGDWEVANNGGYYDSITSTIYGELFGTQPVNAHLYKYNQAGMLVEIKQGNGNTTTYEYNSFGGLRNIKDTNGNIVTSYLYKYKTGDEISAVKPFMY